MAEPRSHYEASERLLGAAREAPESALLAALVHALLAQTPRKTLRGRHRGNPTPPTDDSGRGWGWPG